MDPMVASQLSFEVEAARQLADGAAERVLPHKVILATKVDYYANFRSSLKQFIDTACGAWVAVFMTTQWRCRWRSRADAVIANKVGCFDMLCLPSFLCCEEEDHSSSTMHRLALSTKRIQTLWEYGLLRGQPRRLLRLVDARFSEADWAAIALIKRTQVLPGTKIRALA